MTDNSTASRQLSPKFLDVTRARARARPGNSSRSPIDLGLCSAQVGHPVSYIARDAGKNRE